MDTTSNGRDVHKSEDEIDEREQPQPSNAEGDMEEEPRLKYQRLGSDVAELLGRNAATCLCVSDKILALGTHSGTVHVLDYNGNEVSQALPKTSIVWDIASDAQYAHHRQLMGSPRFCHGVQVKRIEAHKSAVNEICFDEAVEYIASCSDDGTVAVSSPCWCMLGMYMADTHVG